MGEVEAGGGEREREEEGEVRNLCPPAVTAG